MTTKKRNAEKLLEISVDPPAAITLLKRKSVLYWKDYAVKWNLHEYRYDVHPYKPWAQE